MKRSTATVAVAALLLTTVFSQVGLALNTWDGSDDVYWFTPGNWSDNAVPGDGDDVAIHAGATVVLTNTTAILGSLLIDGGELTCSNWNTRIIATNVTVDGGTITLPAAFTDSGVSNRIWIVCSNDFTLTSGTIDAGGKGFVGGAFAPGHGPGGGIHTSYGTGGGHGGLGGMASFDRTAQGGFTNGSAYAPLNPGSGGAGFSGYIGGNGGGAVRIHAESNVVVNGTISADASWGTGLYYFGGGAGGSIYVTCHTLTGSGTIKANGSNSGNYGSGGGGGGRIAVAYDAVAQSNESPAVTFQVAGGTGNSYWIDEAQGQMGTLYFPDALLLTETISLPHKGRLVMATTNWAPDSITATAPCLLQLPDDFQVSVTNDVLLNSGGLDLGWGGNLDVGGNLDLTNGAVLIVRSGPTNGVGPDYGARVAVTGNVNVSSASWIYPWCQPISGESPLFRAQHFSILSANAGIDANRKGYYPGTNGTSGRGPGGGLGGTYGSGGGYGGRGGDYGGGSLLGGVAYGSASAPKQPGSGGGSYVTFAGGHGGGAVRIQADNSVTVNGTIMANGGGTILYGGGGSGGGIHIACQTFEGSGTLIARGADSSYSVGGGGGRISVDYNPTAQSSVSHTVTFSTMPGAYYYYYAYYGAFWYNNYGVGDIGTLYFPDNQFLTETIARPHVGELVMQGVTNWAPDSLTLSAACMLRLPADFQLDVTNRITLDAGGKIDIGRGSDLSVGEDLILTNGAYLYVPSGPTNGVDTEYGALVDVTRDVFISTNCWIYTYADRTNGGSALFRMRDLKLLSPNAGISANGGGYPGGSTRGNLSSKIGMGPGGGGQVYVLGWGSGGGYGGKGGNGSQGSLGGVTNGFANAPAGPGSGGLSYSAPGYPSGDGGGAVRIEASRAVTVDGTISAKGQTAADVNYSGGGSGGGILIACGTFSGSAGGLLSAAGGNAGVSYPGAGGGGRVAVWYGEPVPAPVRSQLFAGQMPDFVYTTSSYAPYLGQTNVLGGTAWSNGAPGTVVFLTYIPPPDGTLILIQ